MLRLSKKFLSFFLCGALLFTAVSSGVSAAAVAADVSEITDEAAANECIASLKTQKNLLWSGAYSYTTATEKGTPGTVAVEGAKNGVKGNLGVIYNDAYLFDGDVSANSQCDTGAFGPDGNRILYVEGTPGSFQYCQNLYTDLTVNLLHPATIEKLFLAQPEWKILRAWKYDIYLSEALEDLYEAEHLVFNYDDPSAARYQTFRLPESLRAQYIGIRVHRGVLLPDYNIDASNSYVRLNEIGVFGEYDCNYYDYRLTSSKEGLISPESGRKMEGETVEFCVPFCKDGYYLTGWRVNGRTVDEALQTDRKTNTAKFSLKLTENSEVTAVYEAVPTEYLGGKFSISKALLKIAVPYGTTANEVLYGFQNPMNSLKITKDGREVSENELLGPQMVLSITGENGREVNPLTVVTAGDLDADGKVTVTDLVSTLERILKGTSESAEKELLMDLNGDGRITVSDVVRIRSTILDDTVLPSYAEQYVKVQNMDYKYLGREVAINARDMDGTNRKALFFEMASSGVAFRVNACGDLSIELSSVRYNTVQEAWLTVVIDGEEKDFYLGDDYRPHKEFLVAENLPRGIHTVEIYRQGECGDNVQTFFGVRVNGEVIEAPQKKSLLIDFAGDSITCGVGNLGQNGVESSRINNGYMAYSAITARMLNADWACMARGGASLVEDREHRAWVPELYLKYTYGAYNPGAYDFKRPADVVVINLGTNDFWLLNAKFKTEAERRACFKAELDSFAETVLEKNGKDVRLVFAFGLMLDENYMDEIYRDTAEELQMKGYHASYCRLPTDKGGYGEHPTVKGDIAAAKVLSEHIKAVLQ